MKATQTQGIPWSLSVLVLLTCTSTTTAWQSKPFHTMMRTTRQPSTTLAWLSSSLASSQSSSAGGYDKTSLYPRGISSPDDLRPSSSGRLSSSLYDAQPPPPFLAQAFSECGTYTMCFSDIMLVLFVLGSISSMTQRLCPVNTFCFQTIPIDLPP